jgi:hypothetical protein
MCVSYEKNFSIHLIHSRAILNPEQGYHAVLNYMLVSAEKHEKKTD